MVLTTPRNNTTAFSTNPFDFDCVLRRNLCVAIRNYTDHCDPVSVFNVISLYPGELMNLATLSLAKGSSISFFFYRNARHVLIWYRQRVHRGIWLEKTTFRSFYWFPRQLLAPFL